MPDSEGRTEAEIQGAEVYPLPALWQAAVGLPQIQAVPDMFPGTGRDRSDTGCNQGELVAAAI
jgi:hypothetical protein